MTWLPAGNFFGMTTVWVWFSVGAGGLGFVVIEYVTEGAIGKIFKCDNLAVIEKHIEVG
mgnify:CR=1 FL=1